MSGANRSDWDLDKLKTRIREQAAEMRERVAASVPLTARSSSAWAFNWLEVKSRLKIAEGLSRLGAMPLLPRFRGLKRQVALVASRVVLVLTRFITSRQTDFNINLLETLREMGEALHAIETRVIQQQEQIHLLEAQLSQLHMRLPGVVSPRRGEMERKAS
jgi:hypothetical protein